MKKYQSFSHLLPTRDRDLLEDLGVELRTNAAIFHKKLTEAEMRAVWRIFAALKHRTGEEDDRVYWALGDWMVQVETWYGEETREKWMPWIVRDLGLEPHRDQFYKLVGGTLIRLQNLEDAITDCCLILETAGLSLSADGFLSFNDKLRKQTLGQLVNSVKNKIALDSEFEARLSQFVRARNRFIHRLWFEEIKNSDFDHSLLHRLEQFSISLVAECDYVLTVFEGFRATLLEEIMKSTESPRTSARTWLSFAPDKWREEAMRMAQRLVKGLKKPS